MIIDSHTHIYAKEFDEDKDAVISRAIEEGVTKMILPNIDRESLGRELILTLKYPDNLYPAIGLHPTEVNTKWQDEINWLKEHFYLYKWVAIGEIGLDYYWSKNFQEQQKECFTLQLRWAIKENLPVIIHSREAFADTFSIIEKVQIEENTSIGGVFHSFTGTEEDLDEALKFENFFIGINGVVTFKNSNLRTFLAKCPLERLLIETDAPYLSPVPYRGKRNEPSYILKTAEELASIYQCSEIDIYERTTANARNLFNI